MIVTLVQDRGKWILFKLIISNLWQSGVILVFSGLKFGVENSTDYNKAKEPIPFRRIVFSSYLDGRPIRGNDVLLLIESDVFKRLDDNDAISLCSVGILQLVLLGVEDRRHVPNWMVRLANDRVSWDNYPWGSYASDPTNETATKSYSIEGFAWAFKTWILESFRVATDDYYTRYRRHPRIIAWSSKHKFYRNMHKLMLHALSNGVPVVAFPGWGDQVTDAKYLADEWKVGIRMSRGQAESKVIGRKEVEMCLREATSGVMVAETKMNALKWKELAEEAVVPRIEIFKSLLMRLGQ
nr:gallate 1-beta-glucosyltransferase-like [Tanacetum cinerariifolium]